MPCRGHPAEDHLAEVGVGMAVAAVEDQAADELGMGEGELLRDRATHREAHDVRLLDSVLAQHVRGVFGHRPDRDASGRNRGAAGAAVVRGDDPVAVRECVDLGLPGLSRVAEASEEQQRGPAALLVHPDIGAACGDVHATENAGEARPFQPRHDRPRTAGRRRFGATDQQRQRDRRRRFSCATRSRAGLAELRDGRPSLDWRAELQQPATYPPPPWRASPNGVPSESLQIAHAWPG